MALLRIGFNEGSLLRRTLLHVGTFVLGSVAFISLMSFLLVSVAKGILPHATTADAAAEQQGEDGEAKGKASAPKAGRKKLPVIVNEVPPAKED